MSTWLSGTRCRLAYVPADATATLAPVNPDWFYLPGFYLSGTCSPGWSRTNSRRAVKWLCVCVYMCFYYVTIMPSMMCICVDQYGVGLDAGSSHTSLYVFKWPAHKHNGTGIVEQVLKCPRKPHSQPSYSCILCFLSVINCLILLCCVMTSCYDSKQHKISKVNNS